MTHKLVIFVLVSLGLIALTGAVLGPLSDPVDRVNFRYIAWKHGLYRMPLDEALDGMVEDPNRDSLVIGKTEAELDAKFGFITSVSEASSYVNYCYFNSEYHNTDAVILRRSNWMVLMHNGRAKQLLRVTGC
jgi:hypothetical protein